MGLIFGIHIRINPSSSTFWHGCHPKWWICCKKQSSDRDNFWCPRISSLCSTSGTPSIKNDKFVAKSRELGLSWFLAFQNQLFELYNLPGLLSRIMKDSYLSVIFARKETKALAQRIVWTLFFAPFKAPAELHPTVAISCQTPSLSCINCCSKNEEESTEHF